MGATTPKTGWVARSVPTCAYRAYDDFYLNLSVLGLGGGPCPVQRRWGRHPSVSYYLIPFARHFGLLARKSPRFYGPFRIVGATTEDNEGRIAERDGVRPHRDTVLILASGRLAHRSRAHGSTCESEIGNGGVMMGESGCQQWDTDPRWTGLVRPYGLQEVTRLQGSLAIDYTLARHGAQQLYEALSTRTYVPALGAVTGNQAVQQVKAGLEAIYVSGWQVAADGNLAGETYPDQSLYPANSVPMMVRRINRALMRADQVARTEGQGGTHWYVPIVADAEAGFGGPLNVFELVKSLIEAGAAGIHLEDQLSSAKKCGHMGGKVLIPTEEAIRHLVAARLAADVMDVPTVIIARTDANGADLLTSDIDPRDRPFLTGERTPEGFYRLSGGLNRAIQRGLCYAPYADLIWCETSEPDIDEARTFAEAIHREFPGKWLAYNCSPSFNWKRKLSHRALEEFQHTLGALGYKFQFITLAGFHALNWSMFDLALQYRQRGMAAYAELQQREFSSEEQGYSAVRHQREVGAGYFDEVMMTISGGQSSTGALKGSTEEAQFESETVKS